MARRAMSEDHKITLGHFHTYNPGAGSSLVKTTATGNITTIPESEQEDSVPARARIMSEDEKGMGYRQPINLITQPEVSSKKGEEYNATFNRRNYGEDEYGNEGRYQVSQLDAEIKDVDEEQLSMRFGNPDNLLEILANHARSKNTRRGSRYLANPELIGEEEYGSGYSQGIGYQQKEENISPHKNEDINHGKVDENVEQLKPEELDPVKHEKLEPVKHESVQPIKHEKVEPIKHEKVEPIKHEKLEPINDEKVEQVKPELEESYQPYKIEPKHHEVDTFKYEEPKMSYSKSQDTPPSITISINPSSLHPSPSLLSPKSPNFQEIPSDLSISHPQSHSNLSSKDFSTSARRSQSSSDSEPESSHPTNPSTISNIEQPTSKPLSNQDSSSDEEPIALVPPPIHNFGPRGTLAGLLPNSNSKSDMIDRNMQKSGLVISERTSNCAGCSVF